MRPARVCYNSPVSWGHGRDAHVAMTMAVVVCAYNEARLLPACLHSLLAQTRPADQIIVVNNASSDDTRAIAESVRGITVVDEPKKGFGRGVMSPHKEWHAIARTLRANVDVAVTLYRNGSWA